MMVQKDLLSIMMMQQGLGSQYLLLGYFQTLACHLEVNFTVFVTLDFSYRFQEAVYVSWRSLGTQPMELSIV